ncbi:MAG: hypothetical protein KIS76_12780 [Pyrinomonadaceae bacterium]|nr:hypothetical protein [Pyrinomonadaceae bacterium]
MSNSDTMSELDKTAFAGKSTAEMVAEEIGVYKRTLLRAEAVEVRKAWI